MKKAFLILLLTSVTLLAAQKVTLQLSWLNQFQFAGYYVAKERGFYKNAGIDVEIKEFDADTNLSTVIEKGKADFAVGRSSLLIDKAEGRDVVALGAIFQQSPLMLLVRDDTHIDSVKDLRNRTIMLTDDAKGTASIMAMLFSNGVTSKDLTILPHSFDLDDLINKKTDAMAAYTSNEPIRLQERGIGYRIFYPKDYGFNFYGDILFTSSAFIRKNPKLTKDFYDASIKGWAYAFDHITETAELIYKHYNTQNKSLIQLIKEGEALKRLAFSKNGTIGRMDRNQLEDMVKVYKVLGFMTKDVDLNTFVYEYNHPKEVAFKLNYDEIIYIGIISVFAMITLGLMALFISLRNQWLMTQSHLKEKIAAQKEEIDTQNRVILSQSKIAAVGEMLANIAHQWRQPLNIISLNTTKMETSILFGGEIKKDEIRQISEEINRQSQYLSDTIDDFRNYFNSDMERMAPFNLKDAITKVTELTKDSFNNYFIESIITVKECTITHNESLFIQALLNIYNNARDAIIQSETSPKYFFVDLHCNADNAVISLKDSGGGIDKEVISRIFEPYYTTKHLSQGTGLGLYITYEIVTKHLNGTLEVHNRNYEYKGSHLKGAEFIITIPRAS
jgi:ABC-type nitrate/sulfonate/bicarbonate transport system substrate-binding protein/nitrogen-specific signal transduction histidine kinase